MYQAIISIFEDIYDITQFLLTDVCVIQRGQNRVPVEIGGIL